MMYPVFLPFLPFLTLFFFTFFEEGVSDSSLDISTKGLHIIYRGYGAGKYLQKFL